MRHPHPTGYPSLKILVSDHRSALAQCGLDGAFDRYGRQTKGAATAS